MNLTEQLEQQLEQLLKGKWPLGTWRARRKTIAALKQLRPTKPPTNQ